MSNTELTLRIVLGCIGALLIIFTAFKHGWRKAAFYGLIGFLIGAVPLVLYRWI